MLAVLIGYVVPAIHVFACFFLIVVVLLQTGKGADMGAVFGGGSQTLFGSSGAGNFLTKLTTGTAITFMVTSLILTYGASRSPTSSLLDKLPATTAPAVPATPPAEPVADATGGPAPAADVAPAADAPAAEAPVTEAPAAAPAPEAAAPVEPPPAP
jgi:preprotein translocase subunit SecG